MKAAALARLFVRERSRFAKVFPEVGRVGLVLSTSHYDARACGLRDLAWYEPHTQMVVLLRRALRHGSASIRGLIRHELGHAADRHLGRAGREQRADDLAERVTGRKIRYGRHAIQTTGPGEYPRPWYLHQ